MSTVLQLPVDASTFALFHFDGALASAAKKDNAEGTAARDIATESSIASVTGWDSLANGAYSSSVTDGSKSIKTAALSNAALVTTLTFEFWVNFQSHTPSGGSGWIWGQPNSDGSWSSPYGHVLRWDTGTTVKFIIIDSGGTVRSADFTGLTDLTTNSNWHYIALTWDGTTAKLYFNGAQVGGDKSLSYTMKSLTQPFYFLGYSPSASSLNGYLDEFRISTVARTATEIYNYYNNISVLNEVNLNRTPIRGVGRGIMRP